MPSWEEFSTGSGTPGQYQEYGGGSGASQASSFRQRQMDPRAEMEKYLAQERGLAGRTYEELAGGKLSVAQQQMQAGLAGTQQMLAGQAAAGGANPLAARSAAYAGGMAGADVSRQTAALRAQEMQAARQMQMGALARGTEGVLAQQQMDLQAAQAAAQEQAAKEAEYRAREQQGWQETKDIVGMASLGMISDPRTKDVYASDRTIKEYIPVSMPAAGGRFGGAVQLPASGYDVLQRQRDMTGWTQDVAPGYIWPPGEPNPVTISDYIVQHPGEYGPKQPASVGARAGGKTPKGKAPEKGAKAVPTDVVVGKRDRDLAFEARKVFPMEEFYSGPYEGGGVGLDPQRREYLEELGKKDPVAQYRELARSGDPAGVTGKRLLFVPDYTIEQYGAGTASPQEMMNPRTLHKNMEMAGEAQRVGYERARQAGLTEPATTTQSKPLGDTSETWEQMIKRIEEEQRRKYYEQGGPGI